MTHLETDQAEAIARILTTQEHNDAYYVNDLIAAAEREFPGWTFTRVTGDHIVARLACSCRPNAKRAWPQAGGEVPPLDGTIVGWMCPTHGAMWALREEQPDDNPAN